MRSLFGSVCVCVLVFFLLSVSRLLFLLLLVWFHNRHTSTKTYTLQASSLKTIQHAYGQQYGTHTHTHTQCKPKMLSCFLCVIVSVLYIILVRTTTATEHLSLSRCIHLICLQLSTPTKIFTVQLCIVQTNSWRSLCLFYVDKHIAHFQRRSATTVTNRILTNSPSTHGQFQNYQRICTSQWFIELNDTKIRGIFVKNMDEKKHS